MADLDSFKRVFGPITIIGENMSKVTKKIQVIDIKPTQYGMKYAFMSTDEEWYSSFDKAIGKHLENLEEGDIVEVEYSVNKKGFQNFTTIKPVENDEEFQPESPEEEPEGVEKKAPRSDKTSDIHRQCAGKIAGMAFGSFDFKGMDNDARAKFFVIFWKTIEDRLNEL